MAFYVSWLTKSSNCYSNDYRKGLGTGPSTLPKFGSSFSHIPGLKVVAPSNAYDAKGLMIESIKDNNPVIFFEHRWVHDIYGNVPKKVII